MKLDKSIGEWNKYGTYDIKYDIAYYLYVNYCIQYNKQNISDQDFFVGFLKTNIRANEYYEKLTFKFIRKEKLKRLNNE